jgi:hypothetical protein
MLHNKQEPHNVTSYERRQPENSWLLQILQSFINPNGRVLQQQVVPRLSREKWDGCKMARVREVGQNFSRVTLAQRMVMK